jgi:hypothetical protein
VLPWSYNVTGFVRDINSAMKTARIILSALLLAGGCFFFLRCDFPEVETRSVVDSDGNLLRAITTNGSDSAAIVSFFGIDSSKGWKTERYFGDSLKTRWRFSKHYQFDSLPQGRITVTDSGFFRIRSTFTRKRRWIYTDYVYADSYTCIPPFLKPTKEVFFSEEELNFIARLPDDGSALTDSADSVLNAIVNRKRLHYFNRILDHAFAEKLIAVLPEYALLPQLIDSVARLYSRLELQPDTVAIVEPLEALLKQNLGKSYYDISDRVERDLEPFGKTITRMYMAACSRYVHRIEVPGAVTATNAPLLQDGIPTWIPPGAKLLVGDYDMVVESREFHEGAILSASVMLLVLVLLLIRTRARVRDRRQHNPV